MLRHALAILAAVTLFAVLAYPAFYASLFARRECYRAFQLVGIMDPKGDLGGQIMGFNYQRRPEWAHFAAKAISAAVAFAPALFLAAALHARITRLSRATRCGRCGFILRDLQEPRCPHCTSSL